MVSVPVRIGGGSRPISEKGQTFRGTHHLSPSKSNVNLDTLKRLMAGHQHHLMDRHPLTKQTGHKCGPQVMESDLWNTG